MMGPVPTATWWVAFADGPGGGNPAPIVADADHLSAEQMQQAAADFGFETAFVLAPRAGGACRFRYTAALSTRTWLIAVTQAVRTRRPDVKRRPDAQRAGRPSNLSILRRSRLVGRPVPRSRAATVTVASRGGGGGLWSMKHSAATGAPARLAITRTMTTTRSRPSWRSRTSSPARTECAGLTRIPLTLTCPARQAPDAAERVLANRTDQIQLSTRPA